MPTVIFIEAEGASRLVDVANGESVMERARRSGVAGIPADCRGACATCRVHVDEAWTERVGKPNPVEEAMLDFAEDVRQTSRLSCQMRMKAALDGLIVEVPAST